MWVIMQTNLVYLLEQQRVVQMEDLVVSFVAPIQLVMLVNM